VEGLLDRPSLAGHRRPARPVVADQKDPVPLRVGTRTVATNANTLDPRADRQRSGGEVFDLHRNRGGTRKGAAHRPAAPRRRVRARSCPPDHRIPNGGPVWAYSGARGFLRSDNPAALAGISRGPGHGVLATRPASSGFLLPGLDSWPRFNRPHAGPVRTETTWVGSGPFLQLAESFTTGRISEVSMSSQPPMITRRTLHHAARLRTVSAFTAAFQVGS
jgi:hypothetical protein